MKNTHTLPELQEDATDHLRRALIGDETERTAHLRAVAEDYVSAREFFYTKTGHPDWTGRTYGYRQWVREVTGAANVPSAELGTVQAAIRYHIGNVLRERLTDDELAAAGLRKESPRERSVEKREDASQTLALLVGSRALDTGDAIEAATTTFARALRRVRLDGLTGKERDRARTALLDLAAEAVRRAG